MLGLRPRVEKVGEVLEVIWGFRSAEDFVAPKAMASIQRVDVGRPATTSEERMRR